MSLDNARIGAAIRMAMLLLASDSGEALLHDGEASLSVEADDFGVRPSDEGRAEARRIPELDTSAP